MFVEDDVRIGVVGLGYVGLPLSVEFAKHFPVVGFDTDPKRIQRLSEGFDDTLEVGSNELLLAKGLSFSSDIRALRECNFFIVAVPTPVNEFMQPDLGPLKKASLSIASNLKRGDIVVYESTVYPGATEEECVPILESTTGLVINRDFYVGYSPERVNPSDKSMKLPDIVKVTSGSTLASAEFIDGIYRKIINAGTFLAPSIKVAEAAKVIENTQRDLNIALVNELAIIFDRLGIDTQSVLEAAGTKWNFLPFKPGLVGGHCIGVDPYYLTHKAQSTGYYPQVILAGRRLNEGMGVFVAEKLVRHMAQEAISLHNARILIMGLTFKENCPDLRNTRVLDVIRGLEKYRCKIEVYDPWVTNQSAVEELGVNLVTSLHDGAYDVLLLAVPHDVFLAEPRANFEKLCKPKHIIFDLKAMLPRLSKDIRL